MYSVTKMPRVFIILSTKLVTMYTKHSFKHFLSVGQQGKAAHMVQRAAENRRKIF